MALSPVSFCYRRQSLNVDLTHLSVASLRTIKNEGVEIDYEEESKTVRPQGISRREFARRAAVASAVAAVAPGQRANVTIFSAE